MPINKESLNRKLYKALGRYEPKPVDDQNEVVPLEDEADAFKFNFVKGGENYGVVYATLDDTNTLTIWYSDDVMNSPDGKTPGLEYDDTWSGFLRYIKRWAMNNQLSFKLENKDHLGNEMARRKRMQDKEKISESYYAMGKKASYSDAVPNVKIILQHSRVMQEGEQRFRHIEKIFVENQNGERFLVPTNRPGLARVFARHIAEGGTPYDERAGHIQSLVEEYNKMAGFVRATKNGQFNESAQKLVNEGVNHYLKLRESLGKLTGHKGYTAYFESWTPPLMEDETDATAINELFVQETLDPRIESVMPILSRLHKQVAEMKEVSELSEWVDSLIEDEGIQSQNPGGIPEGRLDGSGDIDSPVADAILRRILMQRTDLLAKHGPEKVANAIDSVTEFVGDVDEIGSSDVSGWVKQVERELGDNQVEEGIADDYEDMADRELIRHARMLGLEKNIVQDGEGGLANRREIIHLLQQEASDDLDEAEKPGLWANIHAKRKRIKSGSGERMRKPGSKGAPSAQDFKDAAKTSKNEDVMYEGLDPENRARLDDLIDQYRTATDPDDYYNDEGCDPDEVIAQIRSEFGEKIASDVEAGADKMHFGRHGIQRDDPLAWKTRKGPNRVTKAGKLFKQDSDYTKNTIKSRYQHSGKSATEGVEEGLSDIAKKVGGALKTGAKAVGKAIVGPDDDELLRDLKKRAGVRNPQTGKPSMAISDVNKVDEDLGPEQKKVGQLGPTDKVGKKGAVGKLVGANESFINTDAQAVVSEMDSQGYKGTRDSDDEGGKGEGKATPVKAKDVVKKGAKALDKAMDDTHKKDVKEGQEDLDAILRIIRK